MRYLFKRTFALKSRKSLSNIYHGFISCVFFGLLYIVRTIFSFDSGMATKTLEKSIVLWTWQLREFYEKFKPLVCVKLIVFNY